MWLYVSIEHIASFCHKEIHLRCYRGLELNIATTTKILKGIRGHPMIDCNLGKIWKTCPPRCPKYRFPEVFCIKLPYKVKYTSEINEGLVMFLANSGIRFKYSWLDCEQYGKNRYKKKEHNQHSSVFSVRIIADPLIISMIFIFSSSRNNKDSSW